MVRVTCLRKVESGIRRWVERGSLVAQRQVMRDLEDAYRIESASAGGQYGRVKHDRQ
jgi:hypothetical protein